MKIKNKVFLSYLFLISITFLFSGTEGQVRGKVTNVEGENLIGAQIYIEELGLGAVADLKGNYIILNIPVGTYNVKASMISYGAVEVTGVDVMMDNTKWLNFSLAVEAIEGDIIYVSGEKALVEKGSTSKKVSMGAEAIEALPIRDVSELYSLQSGVVKVEGGIKGGIPDQEEKGLEEVHVRGGRSGEIAYLMDGMYLRNPIYGGIGNGTRLNLFAVKEFDWQMGGFNAEYGDAMSAVSNWHTTSGGREFSYKFKYETSLVGQALGSHYDELRGYNDYNLGFGGTVPFIKKINYWISAQYTNKENYKVLQFDSLAYVHGDNGVCNTPFTDIQNSPHVINGELVWEGGVPTTNKNNICNKYNMVQPWDDVVGFRGFGMDNTWDVFGKLGYKLTNQIRFNFSYWLLTSHRKIFSPTFMYWDDGQNELFKDTDRYAFELNHSLSPKTFYSLRLSNFEQKTFQGVRMMDSDSDGFPDWFEWSHGAGERTTQGLRPISDPYNPYVVPYINFGDSVFYTRRDDLGPQDGTSGWYYRDEDNDGKNDVVPGNYNWEVHEPFDDINRNGVFDSGIDIFELENDFDDDGQWTGPALIESCEYRDGSYWLTPEMYVNYEDFLDLENYYNEVNQDPFVAYGPNSSEYFSYLGFNYDSLYFLPNLGTWAEERAFGGHDRFYERSNALTNELRFDLTSQMTDKWRAKIGIDVKSHKLNYYQIINPWDEEPLRQRFAEQWDDYGADGVFHLDSDDGEPDSDGTEGNGQWDLGESFDDFNNNNKWDDFVEPIEFAGYLQNTFEVPWMVINAGIRIDAVDYRSKIWSDPDGNYSPTKPWFWEDCGLDGLCPSHAQYSLPVEDGGADFNGDGIGDPDADNTQNNNKWDTWTIDGSTFSENTTDNIAEVIGGKVFFRNSEWLYNVSPRIGVSHVITDGATFTFNYGVYYQTPVYQNIYLNTNRQEDPQEVIEESVGVIGNATMVGERTQSYEFAFNVQVGRNWAYSVAGWVKDMDRLTAYKTYRSIIGDYSVSTNGDYGTAKGIDITLTNRGQLINTTIQYTYSKAKANGDYAQSAFDEPWVDAPTQEYTMPFDRPHDITVQLYSSKLPLGINAALTGFYESGIPYTGTLEKGDGEPYSDVLNKFAKRTPAIEQVNISFSKYLSFKDMKVSLGLNVFNIFDTRNIYRVYPETGDPYTRSEYFTKEIKLPVDGGTISKSYYDRPWRFSSPREINFFIQIDYK